MWPFSSNSNQLSYRKIDENFVVAGQLDPAKMDQVAAAGFKTIVCARPDNEEPGQPNFAVVKAAAEKAGLKAVHIPISSGIGPQQVSKMQAALKDLPMPMYGYCRSGARAGSLYGAARQAG